MGFANPLLLWALPLGLIPIIIYYLLRFRALRVAWGADYILQLALSRLRRRLHLEQIILLALRTLAVVALVLAFARPVSPRPGASVSGSNVHHVILLDASYSMTAGPPGRTRWDAALDAARKLASTWGRGETWSLCLLGDPPRWVVEGRTIQTPGEPLATLDDLRPAESAASLATALEQVAARFPRGRVELFILADDQALTWDQADRAALPAELSASVYWLNPPSPGGANLAVTSLQPPADRLLQDQPARVAVGVRSFADTAVADLPVELLVDGALAARQTISPLPGQELVVQFDLKLSQSGSHHLCAQIPDDALAFDNRHYAGVEVVPTLRALVLRDAGRAGKFDSAWGFVETLQRSRGPRADAGQTDASRGQIDWALHEGPPDAAAFAAADVILLDGGRRLTPELASALRDFVAAGGGLLVAADPAVDPDAINKLLAGAGLLPARLGRLRTLPLGGDAFRSLARSPIALSSLRLFETELAGDLTQARVFSWFELEALGAAGPPLLRFDDQSPWALRAPGPDGRGRVLLLATGLAGQGNNLIVREFFVPLLHQLVQEAAAARHFPRTLRRGDPPRLWISDPQRVQAVTFARQGADAAPVVPQPAAGGAIAQAPDEGLESGLYSMLTLRDGAGRRDWFGLQGPRVDSDLARASDAVLSAAAKRLNILSVNDWPALEQALLRQRAGRDWYSFAALAAAAFLLAELLFQRRFAPELPRRAAARAPAPRASLAGGPRP